MSVTKQSEAAEKMFMNDWISVKDKMPYAEYGESDSVIVVNSLGVMEIMYYDGGNWCHPTGECYEKARLFPIKYWMPLPKAPDNLSDN